MDQEPMEAPQRQFDPGETSSPGPEPGPSVEASDGLPLFAIAGAVIGAIVSAVAWGLITKWTGYEIGWVAWAVGGAVGFGAATFGGRGPAMGTICAVLAVVAILAGKSLAITWSADDIVSELEDEGVLTQEMYDEMMVDAAALEAVQSDEDLERYLVERSYTDAPTAEDIALFREWNEPDLRKMLAEQPTFEEWKASRRALLRRELASTSVFDTLGLFDVLFLFLGVATAFRIGNEGIG